MRSGACTIFSGELKLLKLINLKGGILKDYTFNLSKWFDRLMHMNASRRCSVSTFSNLKKQQKSPIPSQHHRNA